MTGKSFEIEHQTIIFKLILKSALIFLIVIRLNAIVHSVAAPLNWTTALDIMALSKMIFRTKINKKRHSG